MSGEYVGLSSKIQIPFPYIIGNGATLLYDTIKEKIPTAILPDIIPSYCSVETVSKLALEQWKLGQSTNQLLPLYLKR